MYNHPNKVDDHDQWIYIHVILQGLIFEGGGERKGMYGIVRIERMVGIEIADRGGKLNFGRFGMVGKVGSGGRADVVGKEGKDGKFGMVGNGGNLGRFGGVVVPPLILLKSAKPTKNKAKKKELWGHN